MATILIVDDKPINRDVLVTLLKYGGYQLLEASNGAQALDVVRSSHVDLVIADIIMPTMDGYEFVRQLRLDPAIAHTPVMFYTASYHQAEASALADAAGAIRLLTKPTEPQEILQAVNDILGSLPLPAPAPLSDAFDRDHLRLVTDKLAQKVDDLEAVNRRLTVLIELGQQLVQEHDSAKLLSKFCHAARDIISARYAAVSILNDTQTDHLHFFSSGLDDVTTNLIGSVPPVRGLLKRLLSKKNPARLVDVRTEPDAIGFPPHHPDISSLLCVPIATASRHYGGLYLGNRIGRKEFTHEDERAACTLAAQLAVAYENGRRIEVIQQHAVRLEQEISERKQDQDALRASRQRLESLSRQLMTTQESERQHLARELHDEIGQILTAIKMNLQSTQRSADSSTQGRLVENIDMVDKAISQVRNLSLSLRPAQLDELGLVAALHWFVKQQSQLLGFAEHLTVTPVQIDVSPELSTTCYRITQEALTNAARHGNPQNVWVELRQSDGELQLVIRDDGNGFDIAEARARVARAQCLGLVGMEERAHLAGGQLTITSAPGQGTQIQVAFPFHVDR